MQNKDNMTAAEMLYAARTNSRKPRELPVIAKKLCIREDFLEALETGNYSVLSENVYILGFARNYAIELGLEPEVISAKLKEELGITTMEIPEEGSDGTDASDEPKPAAPISQAAQSSDRSGNADDAAFGNQDSNRKKPLIIAIAALFAIAAGGASYLISSGGTGREPTEQDANAEYSPSKIQFNLPIKFEYSTENKDSSTIVMQALSETWLKIERNGEILFSRVLMPGDIYYAPNKPGARATLGNAGGLDIWVGGKLAPKLGAMHTRVTNIPLTEDAIMNKRIPKPAPAEPAAEDSAKTE
ncbi:MAG: helix-turn-helix domain-containing protein [Rickettsiales bacterium]|jgi:cytoskeletal protein RodZ|nr:helix-turn-helix domain-containing protein [Rickettsiales bacterium]